MVTMNESPQPARAVPPGRIIHRELEARGWNQKDLAAIMGRPEQALSEIMRGKKQITSQTAIQLSKAFGTSAEFWLNLEMQYQLHAAQLARKDTEIELRSEVYQRAPINDMIQRGWIRSSNSANKLVHEYCRFFNIDSIDQVPEVALQARLSSERSAENRAVIAWARRVEQLVVEQTVKEYSPERMYEFLEQLLSFANDEADIKKIPTLFFENGIHFVYVPNLPKSNLDGAVIWVREHPVVALTLRNDRIDAFWFTLLHELAYLFRHYRQAHFDQLFDLADQDLSRDEKEATRLAWQWLIPEEEIQKFIDCTHTRLFRKRVKEFALEYNRHPGIVAGQLMNKCELKSSRLNEYLIRVRPLLEKWEDVPSPN